MPRIIFDLETDGLLATVTKVHCICTKDIDTNELHSYSSLAGNIADGITALSTASYLVGHNALGYDVQVLKKLYPGVPFTASVRDTLLCSRLIWSDIYEADMRLVPKIPPQQMGKHSLESWGHRLGVLKGDYGKTTDWSECTPDLVAYCGQDVEVTAALWRKIESKHYSEEAIQLEHEFAEVIQAQERHGFLFDKPKAIELYATLSKRRLALGVELTKVFPGWHTEMKTPEYWLVLDKRYPTKGAAIEAGHKAKSVLAGPTAKKHIPFNPASRDHIARALIEMYGWKPTEFTAGGKPEVDEIVLGALVYPEAKLLTEYFTVEKRIGQIGEGNQAWIRVENKGRIHGRVTTNGAVTGRCTHSTPNMAQVPAVGKPYGEECRSLFIVPKGYKLAGCDASGLELRCLAHYMARYDGGAYVKELLTGDIHTANQKAAGLPTRNSAKTFIYAYLYGAGDAKIGSIVGAGAKEGKKLKAEFLAKTPALKRLKEDVGAAAKQRGFLIGLDGRHLHIRSAHAALNTLLQSAGALIVKKATIILHQQLLSIGWVFGREWAQVAHVHDELQAEVREDLVEQYGTYAVAAIVAAGEHFKFRCPTSGEFKVGNNWAETH